jgi:cell division protein FtsA
MLKIKHGYALPDKVAEKEEVRLSTFDKKDEGVASVRYVSEIIEARLNEILSIVEDKLKAIGRDGTLPAGVILTGGGAKIEGIVELTKETLRLPAQIGSPLSEINGLVDKLEDPVYATSVGLMLWGQDKGHSRVSVSNASVSGALKKARDFLKQFLP